MGLGLVYHQAKSHTQCLQDGMTGLREVGLQCLQRLRKLYMHYENNVAAESFNAKIKAFRAQLRGVTDLKFFFFRLAKFWVSGYSRLACL